MSRKNEDTTISLSCVLSVCVFESAHIAPQRSPPPWLSCRPPRTRSRNWCVRMRKLGSMAEVAMSVCVSCVTVRYQGNSIHAFCSMSVLSTMRVCCVKHTAYYVKFQHNCSLLPVHPLTRTITLTLIHLTSSSPFAQTTAQKAVEEAERKKNALFRADVEDLCKRRFIFINSFEIYGGMRLNRSEIISYRCFYLFVCILFIPCCMRSVVFLLLFVLCLICRLLIFVCFLLVHKSSLELWNTVTRVPASSPRQASAVSLTTAPLAARSRRTFSPRGVGTLCSRKTCSRLRPFA